MFTGTGLGKYFLACLVFRLKLIGNIGKVITAVAKVLILSLHWVWDPKSDQIFPKMKQKDKQLRIGN